MKPTEQPQRGENWTLGAAGGFGADNRRARRLDRRHRDREATEQVREELTAP